MVTTAHQWKEDAAYSGSYTDGGSKSLLQKFTDYTDKWIFKFDLRPSEFHQLDDIEVGELEEFSNIIEAYKIGLARNIKL